MLDISSTDILLIILKLNLSVFCENFKPDNGEAFSSVSFSIFYLNAFQLERRIFIKLYKFNFIRECDNRHIF